jgi:predicted nucleotidyltransferase
MNSKHGLTDKAVTQIGGVLGRLPAVERAVLFGSRAKSVHKPGSDIDLALVGDTLDWRTLGRIDDALDDLLLPYHFSLVIYGKKTDPEIAAHVERVGVPFYEREPVLTELGK